MEKRAANNRKALICLAAAIVLLIATGLWFFLRPFGELPTSLVSHFAGMDKIEFCTTDPEGSETDYGLGQIGAFSIIDSATIENSPRIMATINRADRDNNSTVATCFWPNHAVRDPDNKANYLLICFKCLQMKYSYNGESGTVLISNRHKPFFEELIEKQGLKRATDLKPSP